MGETIDFATGVRTPFVYSGEWHPKVTYGLVAAGGVEFGGGRLRVAPEIRSTRWLKDHLNDNSSQDYSISGASNQMEILVGFTWR